MENLRSLGHNTKGDYETPAPCSHFCSATSIPPDVLPYHRSTVIGQSIIGCNFQNCEPKLNLFSLLLSEAFHYGGWKANEHREVPKGIKKAKSKIKIHNFDGKISPHVLWG